MMSTFIIDLQRQVAALYSNFPAPAQGNRVSNRRAAHLFAGRNLPPQQLCRADIYQGLLHLDRHHCSPHFCQQCSSRARHLEGV